MEYTRLGSSGLKVSRLCLGTLMFGPPWSDDRDEAIRIIRHALDLGINFIDTGNAYSEGIVESIVGAAIRDRRDQVVVCTKVHFPTGPGPNDRGNSRAHITRAVEESLTRLGTDYIDVYQLHRPDPETPIEETLGVLDDLVRAGKVRYIGTSRFTGWQLVEALWAADRRLLTPITFEESGYSIFQREIEREVLPACERFGLGVVTFSPLDRGWLVGAYARGQTASSDSRVGLGDPLTDHPDSPRGAVKLDLIEKLRPLAAEVGATLSQYALAWILDNPVITAPIVGPLRLDHLEDNIGAVGISIPPEHRAVIDELVKPGTNV
jgi:aryl-alcohol dehydrogenase-like predicted oxidoreductase